jgi:hypothetical protein
MLSKASVVLGVEIGSGDSALYRYNARESTTAKLSAKEKKFKGFPMFFTFENFKRAFLGDMRQWWSRH